MNNEVGKDRLAAMISGKESWDNPDTVRRHQAFLCRPEHAGLLPARRQQHQVRRWFGPAAERPGGHAHERHLEHRDVQQPGEDARNPSASSSCPPSTATRWSCPAASAPAGWCLLPPRIRRPSWSSSTTSSATRWAPRWVTEINAVPAYPVDTEGLGRSGAAVLCLEHHRRAGRQHGLQHRRVTPDNFNKVMWDGFAAVLAGSQDA